MSMSKPVTEAHGRSIDTHTRARTLALEGNTSGMIILIYSSFFSAFAFLRRGKGAYWPQSIMLLQVQQSMVERAQNQSQTKKKLEQIIL